MPRCEEPSRDSSRSTPLRWTRIGPPRAAGASWRLAPDPWPEPQRHGPGRNDPCPMAGQADRARFGSTRLAAASRGRQFGAIPWSCIIVLAERRWPRGSIAISGKALWEARFPTDYAPSYTSDDGPRVVPLIEGERVFLYGAMGELRCLELPKRSTRLGTQDV